MTSIDLRRLFSPLAHHGEEARAERQKVRDNIHGNATLSVAYIVMNALATIVACYGLLSDSTAVVIGAMIIALLLGPIEGIALALVDGDNRLLRRAFLAEAIGAALVLVIAFTIGLIHSDIPITNELLARSHPNIMDLIIALAGGAAGAYATISPRVSAGLVGVAVATALVPPLSSCGIFLAEGHLKLAFGAFLLFVVNLVAIQFASSVMLWLHGFHLVIRRDAPGTRHEKRVLWQNAISFIILLMLTIVMAVNFSHYFSRQRFENDVKKTLEGKLADYQGVYLADTRFQTKDKIDLVTAVVRTPFFLTPVDVKNLENALPVINDKKPELHILSVIVKEAASRGYLHEVIIEDKDIAPKTGVIKILPEENKQAEDAETKNIQLFGH